MAGLHFFAQTAEHASTTSKLTLLQILAPTNQRVKVREISVSFQGTSNTGEPIVVQVIKQSTAGTGGSSLTLVKFDADYSETIQTTALENIATAEPTTTSIVISELVHPQGGFHWTPRWGEEIVLNGADRLGVAVTAGASVGTFVRMICEE